MDNEINQIIQAMLECIVKYPEGNQNKEWFTALIQNSLNNLECSEIDSDLFYNATTLERILSFLLVIDIRTIVKIRMVQKVITTMWEENKWDQNLLNKYVLDEKPIITNNPINYNENSHQITSIQDSNQNPIAIQPALQISLEETPIIEIDMIETENDHLDPVEVESTTSTSSNSYNNIIGNDISTIIHYDQRNRKYDPTNPFFITKGKNFKLGTLMANTPGKNKKEQLLFLTNLFKLPKNSDLIQFEFREGNSWITLGFDFEEDLIFCMDKIKNKDLINLIQIHTDKGKNKIHQFDPNTPINEENSSHTIKDKKTLKTIEKPKQPSKKSPPSSRNDKRVPETSTTKTSNNKITKTSNNKTTNPYKITNQSTPHQGGFLAATIPGNNRKEQLDHIANILEIPIDNDLITPLFHEGNNWITASFNNPHNLEKCILDIKKKTKQKLNMIALNTKSNTKNTYKNNFKEREFKMTEHLNQSKVYRILDIPLDYSNERIKGALKHFGKIYIKQTIKTQFKKEKVVLVTITPTQYSKEISNRWSIPLGHTMARIVPEEFHEETLRERNQYTARLYGIPKNTNTVILTQSIKHLKPKTCYIPRCSISGKERGFAIVSFQNKIDLDKACTTHAKYLQFSLTWSKSNKTKNTYQIVTKSPNTFLSDDDITKNDYSDNKSVNLSFSLTTPSRTTTSSNKCPQQTPRITNHRNFIKKGKKYNHTCHTNNDDEKTTSKLIELITQIATRLDLIENQMANRPDCS